MLQYAATFAACWAPEVMFLAPVTPLAQLLKHTWSPGFWLAGASCLVLRDAADRGRLGAGTFKRCAGGRKVRACGRRWRRWCVQGAVVPCWPALCGVLEGAAKKHAHIPSYRPMSCNRHNRCPLRDTRLNLGLAAVEVAYTGVFGASIASGLDSSDPSAARILVGSGGFAGYCLYQYATAKKT